jgi:signal transduction histidine kinase
MVLFVVITGIMITALANFVFQTYHLYFQSATDDVLQVASQLLQNTPNQFQPPGAQAGVSAKVRWVESVVAQQPVQVWAYQPVVSKHGVVKAQAPLLVTAQNRFKPAAMVLGPQLSKLKPWVPQTIRLMQQNYRVLVVPADAPEPCTWVAVLPLATMESVRDQFLGTLQWVVIGLLVSTCVLVMLVTQSITRPIRHLIGQIHATHFDSPDNEPIELKGVSEVHHLADAFNQMIGRIRGEQNEIQQFVIALTHDLKVPLLAEKQAFDYWRRGIYGPVQAEQYTVLEALQQANRSALDLITNLLDLHRFERGHTHFDPHPLAVQPMFEQLLQEISPAAHGKRITLKSEADTAMVVADSPSMRRVLYNLLVNALAHTQRGGTITCRFIAHPSRELLQSGFAYSSLPGPRPFSHAQALIQVEDSGIGFSAEALSEVFAKVPRHQKRTPLSTGLGLYSCYQTVQAQGGHIWIESTEGEGTLVQILLPRADTPMMAAVLPTPDA